MSCGSRTTVTEVGYDSETAERVPWLSHIIGILSSTLARAQRRQLRVELEKARQQGLLNDFDERMRFRDYDAARPVTMNTSGGRVSVETGRRGFWQNEPNCDRSSPRATEAAEPSLPDRRIEV